MSGSKPQAAISSAEERLNSWKEIAAYLRKGARTVQRWDREQGLPIHRLPHDKLGSVYAYRWELDTWWATRSGELAREATAEAGERAPSIAVLPFSDMSEQRDQEYFCNGLAEEIINALTKVEGLRVASRTSAFQFKGEAAGSREIGKRLHVRALLEGSVRRAQEHLRVGVQLVDVETGFQLWSGRYDRAMTDVFAIQEEIAENVVRELEITLSPKESAALHTPPTGDVGAFDCYLRGRSFYSRYGPRDVEFALEMFSRAAQLDPNYARAFAGLADCWSYLFLYKEQSPLVRDQAEWASAKAVELDPNSAEAQASRGLSLSLSGKDEEAERAFETAIRLDPGLFEAYYYYARHSFARGDLDKSVELYVKAMAARPDDFQSPLLAAQIYDALGRADDAREHRRRGIAAAEHHLQLNPDDARAIYMMANGHAALGDARRAREGTERAMAMAPDDPMLLYNAGCIHSLLGDVEPALNCLERAVEHGLIQRGWYEHDSNLDAVRDHVRFQRLIARLG